MADGVTTKNRVYEEGNKNFRICEYDAVNKTYGELTSIEGLVNVDITFSQTTDNKAADDVTDYLVRKSPLTGSGTITFMGLTKEQYKLLYANIVDDNGVLTFGDTGSPKRVGIMFDNTQGYEGGTSTNRMVLYNCVFDVPSLNTTTLEEDNTDVREFALNVTCSAVQANGKNKTYSILNSVDDEIQFVASGTAMYSPFSVETL